ncbi:hypothetical protein LOK49_LG07G01300 [Camellia lanceoleosa]|uniref:Uncharacterized protein n=1 Tax=Camellia lanceoleosa TaxID=1840588 RepID=A0ACC0GZU8_9ERIC|nr:hypothetical protein LOK49_LG07G01300 [Camellia lanceoleosa]
MGIKTIFKPKQNPEQLLREWQRRLQQEYRRIESLTRGITLKLYSRKLAKFNEITVVHTVGQLSKSTEVTKLVNELMKVPEISSKMKEFRKQMTKAGVIDEIVNETIDKALDLEDEETEIDQIVVNVVGQLSKSLGKYNGNLPYQRENFVKSEESMVEVEDEMDNLEEIEEQLARLVL